ncbi:hypothetical protein [Streptomyces sp. 7-21]|uniref:hypothetical protein n=1 Tax=Streptomyces sp. 7-21 TaxID=2802283 RepID=UPI00191DC8AD|nr:hypothetical protein [Streptomyces sp. 7-21]MBL1068482.1 hypothetical protein [Streptomyces sp. 7-21]
MRVLTRAVLAAACAAGLALTAVPSAQAAAHDSGCSASADRHRLPDREASRHGESRIIGHGHANHGGFRYLERQGRAGACQDGRRAVEHQAVTLPAYGEAVHLAPHGA